MKKFLRTITSLTLFAAVAAPLFAEEQPPVVVIEPMPYSTVQLPYTDEALSTNWTGSDQPEGWNAISVLNLTDVADPDKLPLPCEYPSNWKYSADLQTTAISDNRIAAHVLMLPYIEVPSDVENVTLSFEAMIDGKNNGSITYCATEGEDIRFNGDAFLTQMLSAVMDPAYNAVIPTGGKDFHKFDFTLTGKQGKGLNIVLVAVNMVPTAENVTYAIRNVKVFDANTSVSSSEQDNINVYDRGGDIVVENAPEGATLRIISLQSGIQYEPKIVASASETMQVPASGVYAVVVENGDDVKSFKVSIQ